VSRLRAAAARRPVPALLLASVLGDLEEREQQSVSFELLFVELD